jgi:phage portal protein BeeE
MGRKKLYITENEQRDAKSQRNKRYYDKNKQRLNETAMQRYRNKLGKKVS